MTGSCKLGAERIDEFTDGREQPSSGRIHRMNQGSVRRTSLGYRRKGAEPWLLTVASPSGSTACRRSGFRQSLPRRKRGSRPISTGARRCPARLRRDAQPVAGRHPGPCQLSRWLGRGRGRVARRPRYFRLERPQPPSRLRSPPERRDPPNLVQSLGVFTVPHRCARNTTAAHRHRRRKATQRSSTSVFPANPRSLHQPSIAPPNLTCQFRRKQMSSLPATEPRVAGGTEGSNPVPSSGESVSRPQPPS
jgi:hypothetical protein